MWNKDQLKYSQSFLTIPAFQSRLNSVGMIRLVSKISEGIFLFLPLISTNSISRLLYPLLFVSHFVCNWLFYIKAITSSTLVYSISKSKFIIIYFNMVLLEQTVLKPRLTQSNDIKLVPLKHHYKLVECDIVAWLLRWTIDVCLERSFSFWWYLIIVWCQIKFIITMSSGSELTVLCPAGVLCASRQTAVVNPYHKSL